MLDKFYNSFEVKSEQEILIEKKCGCNDPTTILGY